MKSMICICLLVLALFGFAGYYVCTAQPAEPVSYEAYVVQEGDTLWAIASNSDMWNKIDASYIIDDMKEESNCSSLIYPGQIVYIPMYEN